MHNIADSELIGKIWEALNAPKIAARPTTVSHLTNKFLKQGWADLVDVSDLIWAADGRLNVQVSKLAKALNIPVRNIYPRPHYRNPLSIGKLTMATADVANLLIDLERLGFEVEPLVLVEPLIARLKKSTHVNDSELSVIWYHRQHHKNAPLILVENPSLIGHMDREIKTAKKYKIEIWKDERGKATMIQSYAPKYRASRGAWPLVA